MKFVFPALLKEDKDEPGFTVISFPDLFGIGSECEFGKEEETAKEVLELALLSHRYRNTEPTDIKYLKAKLIVEEDRKFIKLIGDKYFVVKMLNSIIKDYKNSDVVNNDNNVKKLYKLLLSNLELSGIKEDDFVKYLCDDIFCYETEKISKFTKSLKSMIE